MERIKNIHEGKRFWICGSGGSLLTVDEKKIPKGDIIMCCNSAVSYFKKFDYAVFTDGTANFSKWYIDLKKIKNITYILLNNEISSISPKTIYLEKNFLSWKFSKDDKQIIGGYDVIHCATHVAYMMGANEIILCGVDLKHYSKTQKHCNSQELIEGTPEGLIQTVTASIKANESLFDGHLGMSLAGWEVISTHNKLNIRSIGVGGNLNIYPVISFNDLINELS